MEFIKQEHRGNVLILTIDRQAAFNALDVNVMGEIKEAIGAVDVESTRCVIITGAGDKAFVAGADIAYMQNMNKKQAEEWALVGYDIFRRIEKLPIPVIAAINGFALGGGCELALSCDIRLAAENASFSQPEVGLGITAGFGGTQRLPRLVGEGIAKEMLYTGAMIKAQRALEIGLVNAIYPKDELLDASIKMAEAIAKNAPIAIRATKLAIDEARDKDIDTALKVEARHFGDCFESADQREGMTAMLEKRKPAPFTGK